MGGPRDNYIPGCEHFPGYNNGKRDLVYGGCDGNGHKPNPLDDGFNISTGPTSIYIYGGNKGHCDCGGGKWWQGLLGNLVGSATALGITALLTRNNSSVSGSGLFGGSFNSGVWGSGLGGGSSIFGSGFGSSWGGGSYGGFAIDNSWVLPYQRIGGNSSGNSVGNSTGNTPDANSTPNTGNTPNAGSTPGTNNSNTGNTSGTGNTNSSGNTSGSENGNGNGTMPTADAFNNAIDDLLNGKEHLYYGHAENTTHTNYEHTISKKTGDGVSNEDVKKGIRKGAADGKTLPTGETADTKVKDGYYKYITLTDATSNNQYTYQYESSSNGQLKYKLVPNLSDTTKDDNGSDKGWELTQQTPTVVITIEDGIIHLKSDGDAFGATKLGK